MFCTNCGNTVEDHARFCSKCGKEIVVAASTAPGAAPAPRKRHDMGMHVHILGWTFVVLGILLGLFGLAVILAGQIIPHFPAVWAHFPPFAPQFFGLMAALIGLTTIVLAAGVAAAGAGLFQYRNWARVSAAVLAVLMVFKFPIGTAISIYTFWVLFSHEGGQYYKAHTASTMA
jgi:zinc-ribbon domain